MVLLELPHWLMIGEPSLQSLLCEAVGTELSGPHLATGRSKTSRLLAMIAFASWIVTRAD
jgi:hypothetical protein